MQLTGNVKMVFQCPSVAHRIIPLCQRKAASSWILPAQTIVEQRSCVVGLTDVDVADVKGHGLVAAVVPDKCCNI